MTRFAILVLVACVLAKTAAIASLGPAPVILDAAEYQHLAELARGGDVMMTAAPIAYRTPLYPWWLAIMGATGDRSPAPAIISQVLLHVASITLAAGLAWRITGRPMAAIIVLTLSLAGTSAAVYTSALLTETLFVTLLMVHLSMVWKATTHPTWAVAAAGLTLGLLLLTRPIVIWLWPVHAVWWMRGGSMRRVAMTAARIVVMIAVAALVVSPWLVRNQRMFGRLFLTQFTGRNLWIPTFQGGSGAALDLPTTPTGDDFVARMRTGTNDTGDPVDWRHTWSVSSTLRDQGMADDEADRLMKRVAVDAIMQHPGTVAYKTVRRAVNFWRTPTTWLPRPPAGNGGSWIAKWIDRRLSRSVAFNTATLLVTIAASVVMIVHRPTRRVGVWLSGVLLYFNAVTALVEIPDYRYRMVLEPIQMAMVGMAACIVVRRDAALGEST